MANQYGLSDAEYAYLVELQAKTGIPTDVAVAWIKAENGRNNNVLNISNPGGGFASFGSPQEGADAASSWIMGTAGLPIYYYGNIKDAILKWHSDPSLANEDNIVAQIIASPWEGTGYASPGAAPHSGGLLLNVYKPNQHGSSSNTIGANGSPLEANPSNDSALPQSGGVSPGGIAGFVSNGIGDGIKAIFGGMGMGEVFFRSIEVVSGGVIMAFGFVLFYKLLTPSDIGESTGLGKAGSRAKQGVSKLVERVTIDAVKAAVLA